jgi:hypothetical protein
MVCRVDIGSCAPEGARSRQADHHGRRRAQGPGQAGPERGADVPEPRRGAQPLWISAQVRWNQRPSGPEPVPKCVREQEGTWVTLPSDVMGDILPVDMGDTLKRRKETRRRRSLFSRGFRSALEARHDRSRFEGGPGGRLKTWWHQARSWGRGVHFTLAQQVTGGRTRPTSGRSSSRNPRRTLLKKTWRVPLPGSIPITSPSNACPIVTTALFHRMRPPKLTRRTSNVDG